MASALKKVMIVLVVLVLLGIAAFAALIAYAIVADDKAKAKATGLCAPAVVGSSTDVALDRAKKAQPAMSELRWRDIEDGTEELLVVFPAGLPLTAYLCTMTARDGVVASAEVTQVD